MVNITIDGKPYSVKEGITLIEAIDQARVDLPRYCYHPALSIAGNCRICQVEVVGMPRTVIACNTRVAEGMAVLTESSKAKKSQQTVLEFLLANHPLDCPVCDQAGECKLQDYYMDYGLYQPMFNEMKVKKTKKAFSIGPTIMLDQERCILCSRCVRFGDEITKTNDFGIFNRGDHAELNVYPGKELNNNYSGNVADICPVGALTDKDFRFKMRVWYLGRRESVCPGCSRGCNIHIEYEKSRPYKTGKRVMRLKPRENQDVNKWWICDEGRYGYKAIDENRLTELKAPGLSDRSKQNGSFRPARHWAEALEITAELLKKGNWALLATPQATNEELFLMRRLFIDQLKWKNVAFANPKAVGTEDAMLMKKDKNPNTAGAEAILGRTGDGASIVTVLDSARRGELDGLYIIGHDAASIIGLDAWNQVRAKTKTIIFEGPNDCVTAKTADIVLPAASYAEKDGTFTNFEGRVQRIFKAVEPLGLSRPSWQIHAGLWEALEFPAAYTGVPEIFSELSKTVDRFKGMTLEAVGRGGMVWKK